jgi:hypothetical protein
VEQRNAALMRTTLGEENQREGSESDKYLWDGGVSVFLPSLTAYTLDLAVSYVRSSPTEYCSCMDVEVQYIYMHVYCTIF